MKPNQKKGNFIDEALQELQDILAVVRDEEIANAMGYLLSKKIREALRMGFDAGIQWKRERSQAFGKR
jgi:hypothetical protein